MSESKNPAVTITPAAKPPKKSGKRATAAVDALALYPLPPDKIDEAAIEILSEATRGEQIVRVVSDGRSVWKEVV